MSLRHAFKSRFLDSKGDSDVVVKGFRSLEKEEEAKMTCSFDDDEEPTECMSSVTEETRDSDHKSKKMDESTKTASVPDDSVAIYESQLTQLQEQLVETMIENQNLKRELELMKDADKVKKLEKNLEIQTGKNKYLARKLEVLQRMRDAELKSQWVDLSEEATETFVQVPEDTVPEAEGWFGRIKTRLFWTFYDILDDFREEETNDQEIEEEPLAVKKLKKNVKRFGNSFKEILSTIKGLNLLLSWKSPAKTLLVFLSYLYFLSMGWILPGILFLMVFRLFISYLQYKGFRIELHYFRVVEDKDDSEEKELGVADKFNIVVQVATKVQNTLGLLADQMEKLKNLLTWQEPEQTQRLFGVLVALFIASCLLPGRIFFFIAGLQVGFKLFIQDPIFNRFPRVKEKYDTVYKMWKILPTDDQLQKRDSRAKMLKLL
ncbi:GRAM domain-containing protein 4-like [Lingula anatina]|uniref:GRAM domain-containing protein 4-like n=1 Tax=Lingula anatina TaxID=7574 RepID=A0A2R2MQU5_LINAN|nr:GRAM domain-containing protein 4-like [Lingula anatina]|eukprot:XP_023932533.1 GRAM domain-containing protein 4-like [Lingula anatina]